MNPSQESRNSFKISLREVKAVPSILLSSSRLDFLKLRFCGSPVKRTSIKRRLGASLALDSRGHFLSSLLLSRLDRWTNREGLLVVYFSSSCFQFILSSVYEARVQAINTLDKTIRLNKAINKHELRRPHVPEDPYPCWENSDRHITTRRGVKPERECCIPKGQLLPQKCKSTSQHGMWSW